MRFIRKVPLVILSGILISTDTVMRQNSTTAEEVAIPAYLPNPPKFCFNIPRDIDNCPKAKHSRLALYLMLLHGKQSSIPLINLVEVCGIPT